MNYQLRYFTNQEIKSYLQAEQKKYLATEATDFMILTGYREHKSLTCFTDEGSYYYPSGDSYSISGGTIYESACPVLPLSEQWNEIDSDTIKLGLYPQWLASREETYHLEECFRNNELHSTGLAYTLYDWDNKSYSRHIYPVYSLNEQLYIRYVIQKDFVNDKCMFFKNRYFLQGEAAWVKVTPVEWLVDRNNSLLVSRYCLVYGVPVYDYKKFIRFMGEDMFQLNLIAEERLKNSTLGETSLSHDIDYIREQLNLSRGISNEATPFLDRALDRLDIVSDKIDTSYQKVKK